MRRRHRHTELAKRLSRPALLEESGPPLVLPALLALVTLLLAGAAAWAGVTRIEEVARTSGEIVPIGQVHRIQHIQGGRIGEIAVAEGEIVERGQPLVRLDAKAAEANVDSLRARLAGLRAKAVRLRAFIDEQKADFSAIDGHGEIIRKQRQALQTQREARERRRDVLKTRIARQRTRLKSLQEQKTGMEKQVTLLQKAVRMRQDLRDEGLVSEVVLLENERALSKSRNQLARTQGDILETRQAIDEAKGQLAELDARLKADASDKLSEVQAELSEVVEILQKHQERTRRTLLTAPVAGVVQGIEMWTQGTVVEGGETILEIVPVNDRMIAEVRLAPRHIGHVHKGQDVHVKLTSYDFTRFGAVPGTLKHISATTFQDSKGNPFYKARISLKRPYLGTDSNRHPILPGMVVEADIRTGDKTLLTYITQPVTRGLDHAFTER